MIIHGTKSFHISVHCISISFTSHYCNVNSSYLSYHLLPKSWKLANLQFFKWGGKVTCKIKTIYSFVIIVMSNTFHLCLFVTCTMPCILSFTCPCHVFTCTCMLNVSCFPCDITMYFVIYIHSVIHIHIHITYILIRAPLPICHHIPFHWHVFTYITYYVRHCHTYMLHMVKYAVLWM